MRVIWLLASALALAYAPAPQNSGTAASPPIARPSFEPDQGPTIAIDEAHKNTHTLGGQFQALVRLLRRDGYRVRALAEPISRQSLERIDILVIAQPGGWDGPDASLTPAEVSALLDWVGRGGSLLVILDHMPAPAAAERLTMALGIERWHNGYAAMETPDGPVFNLRFQRAERSVEPAVLPLFGNLVAWQGPGARLREHVVTSGRDAAERADSVVTFGGSAFQAPAAAEPLLDLPVGAVSLTPATTGAPFTPGTPRVPVAGWQQAAVMTVDRGRVGLFADAGLFSVQWPVHPAAAHNYTLVLNVMRWLGKSAQQVVPDARRIWGGPGVPLSGSASLDGRYLSYTDPATGDLAIRDLTTGTSRRLTNTRGWSSTDGTAGSSVLSADGRQVACIWSRAGGHEVRILPVEGGAMPRVVTIQEAPTHYLELVAWTRDNRQLFLIQTMNDRTGRIAVLSLEDGSLRPIKSLGHHFPRKVSLSPDGRHVAYDTPAADGALDIFVMASDGTEATAVVTGAAEDSGPIWAFDGSLLLFFSDRSGTGSLWTIPVKDGKPAGEVQSLKEGTARINLLGATRDERVYYSTGGPRRNVRIAELDEALNVTGSPRPASVRVVDATVTGSWSPDGQSLAYYAVRGDPAGSIALVIRSMKTGEERIVPLRLTQGPNEGSAPPRWFPDNRSVLVAAMNPDEPASVPRTGYYRVDVSTGHADLLHAGWSADFLARNPALSSDGKTLYYSESPSVSELRSWNIFRLDLDSRQKINLRDWMPKLTVRSMVVSPDGSQFAYLALDDNRSGRLEVMPSSGGPAREIIRLTPWFGVSTFSTLGWTPDGRHLLFAWSAKGETSDMELYRVSVTGGRPEKMGVSLNGELQHPQVHPDGRRISFSTKEAGESDIWSLQVIRRPAR